MAAPAEEQAASAEEQLKFGRRSRRVRGRSWVALLVVAAFAATAVWYLHRPEPRAPLVVTYAGSTVADPAGVIAGADHAFVRYVGDKHGALSSDARCYFNRVGGWATTDVAPTLFCGPALFYGGAAPELWLRYVLSPSHASDGHIRLSMAGYPETTAPIDLPGNVILERPDGSTPPTGADGLAAPEPPPPPPADRDVIARVRRNDVPRLPVMPATSIIGSRDLNIRLMASGFTPSYGHDLGTRPAPSGEKLLAFELQVTPGEVDPMYPNAQLPLVGLAVDGGPVRRLPIPHYVAYGTSAKRIRYVVAAVPADVRQADLVVIDGGITQRLSLLSGVPDADNIALLVRDPRELYGRTKMPRTALARIHKSGATFIARLEVYASTPYLGYFSPYGPEHAIGPDGALLNVTVSFQTPRIPCPGSSCGFSFHARNLTLEPTGGQPISADKMSNGYPAFDVPESFHAGTVTVAGSTRAGGATVTLIHPFRVKVALPN